MDQPEQDVLGADVVVVEKSRLFLREHDHSAGPVGKPFEQARPPCLIWERLAINRTLFLDYRKKAPLPIAFAYIP
jgi:hypothetical protein